MKGSKGLLKKLLSGILSICLLASPLSLNLPASTVYAAETVNEGVPQNFEDGTILHAFCWSFDTIKNNMASIAAAGYSAIQTSPINECADNYPAMTLMGNNGKWYYHYQPTDWKIGNYQLGTRSQFISMCNEADKYGIKIIVDVVPNHTAADTSLVSSNLINAVGGVDGFRYDTAKHIGLPDDPTASGVNNNFWTRVTTEITNASNIFNYGEVLQGANERLTAYQNMLDATTASSYGASIRSALSNYNFAVSNIMYHQVDSSANVDKLVTWVESHDNYINDGTWSQLNETQIKLGWAIIVAREAGTPLFFSRPYGSSTSNQFGTNTIGIAGSDFYKSAVVTAVNKFRNAMVGQSEYLRNPANNTQVLMIGRGSKGVTIVNGSSSSYNLSSATTNLADGTYYDHVSAYVYGDSTAFGSWPGKAATNEGNGWWKVTVPANVSSNLHIIFNDGGNGSQSADYLLNNAAYIYSNSTGLYNSKSAAQ